MDKTLATQLMASHLSIFNIKHELYDFSIHNIKPLFSSVSLLACEAEIEEIGAIIIKEDLEGGNCLVDLTFKNIIF